MTHRPAPRYGDAKNRATFAARMVAGANISSCRSDSAPLWLTCNTTICARLKDANTPISVTDVQNRRLPLLPISARTALVHNTVCSGANTVTLASTFQLRPRPRFPQHRNADLCEDMDWKDGYPYNRVLYHYRLCQNQDSRYRKASYQRLPD